MRLFKNEAGSVATIFAMVLPILALIGAASIEYSRVVQMKHAFQDSADAAILAAARLSGGTDEARTAVAMKFMDANLDKQFDATRFEIKVEEMKDTGSLKIVGSAHVPSMFADLLSLSSIEIGAYAEVKATVQTKLELALVLDTTGSMNGSKITALKDAAKTLTDTIMDGDLVKVSIAPFARYVNVGMEHRDHRGLDVPDDEPGTRKCQKEKKQQREYYNCRTTTKTCYNDGVPYSCTQTNCDSRVVREWEEEVCRTQGKKTWSGCIGSRTAPLNATVVDPDKGVPGMMNTTCGNNKILRLNKTKSTVQNAIKNLGTGDQTYIPAGLYWGWAMLTPEYPFPDGEEPEGSDIPIDKVMVVMTDGANTVSQSGSSHGGSSASAANTLTDSLCVNIKADEIRVYTIAFEVTDPTIKALLEKCATSSDMFYDAKNIDELKAAFVELAADLTELHLAR